MRTLGTWITDVDEAIMECLQESGYELPPSPIAHNLKIEASTDHVGRRLRKLEKAGFLRLADSDRGYYGITDLGESVVNDQLSREEINELEPDG